MHACNTSLKPFIMLALVWMDNERCLPVHTVVKID